MERKKIIVSGQVQGVGFRPFLWRKAHELGLSGFCQNTSAGVALEVQGASEQISRFMQCLHNDPPPLAKITAIEISELPIEADGKDFQIIKSHAHAGQNILVAPDIATCHKCAEEILDKNNARFQYAFTNCVNCGPRYSITASLPYDRCNTVMSCFKLCPACKAEFENPADRRFHAQPIACQVCGPRIWHVAADEPHAGVIGNETQQKALEKACETILSGGILALKGLGGFQLACNACDYQATARLRNLKNRPHKAFAVMTDNLFTAAKFALLTPLQKNLLDGREKPIVLCQKRRNHIALAANVAPDVASIGIMLPYTPLHILLFNQLKITGLRSPCLVMTSGNPANEPICLGNREAIAKLSSLCDSFLLHNRDILVRVDDSVVYTTRDPWQRKSGANEELRIIRRARGFVPTPVKSPFYSDKTVLGMGAELKSTFTLTRGSETFSSQHIGDLSSPANLDFYEQTLAHLEKLLAVKPEIIVTDLHPDFLSTQMGQQLGRELRIPVIALQHHAAHASAVLAENNYLETALAVCLDGSGLGADGAIWGGEFLKINLSEAQWERVGKLREMLLPGGEQAIKEPWRIARWLDKTYTPSSANISENSLRCLDEMLEKKINAPGTSSCGRLFDAVSARIGICEQISYEGQAAIRLEHEALKWLAANQPDKLPKFEICFKKEKNLWQLNIVELFKAITKIFQDTKDTGLTAAAFHLNLAKVLAKMAIAIAAELRLSRIAFTGGVMLNQLLLNPMLKYVREAGFIPLQHVQLPCGDASISYGQAVWGQSLYNLGKCQPSGSNE